MRRFLFLDFEQRASDRLEYLRYRACFFRLGNADAAFGADDDIFAAAHDDRPTSGTCGDGIACFQSHSTGARAHLTVRFNRDGSGALRDLPRLRARRRWGRQHEECNYCHNHRLDDGEIFTHWLCPIDRISEPDCNK